MDGRIELFIALLSAGAGALSTYVMARVDRVHLIRRIDALAEARARDRQLLIFYGTTLGDIANKNNMGERFSTGIMRVLSLTPSEGTDDRYSAGTNEHP